MKSKFVHYSAKFRILFYVLAAGFILALTTLIILIIKFSQLSLQRDFSAYYTAGEALNHGLSPYVNYFDHVPPIWDGIAAYHSSRFLYPPLVANFFQWFALAPYGVSKVVWSVLNLLAMLYSIYYANELIFSSVNHPEYKTFSLLTAWIYACLFFPAVTYFERGQIDAITLLFLTLGIGSLLKNRFSTAGIFLALAALIKINILLILPFLMIRKYRKSIPYLLLTFVVLGALTLALNKWITVQEFVVTDLPRIIRYGQHGPLEVKLSDADLEYANGGSSLEMINKQGKYYAPYLFTFSGNGSLLRTSIGNYLVTKISRLVPSAGTLISSFLFYLLAAAMCSALWLRSMRAINLWSEYLFWALLMLIVLLISPLTWVMNLVWITILIPILVVQLTDKNQKRGTRRVVNYFAAAVCMIGFLLIAIPDFQLHPFASAGLEKLFKYKYVLGEILLMIWLTTLIYFRLDLPLKTQPV